MIELLGALHVGLCGIALLLAALNLRAARADRAALIVSGQNGQILALADHAVHQARLRLIAIAVLLVGGVATELLTPPWAALMRRTTILTLSIAAVWVTSDEYRSRRRRGVN